MSNRKRIRHPATQRRTAQVIAARGPGIAEICQALLDDTAAEGRLLLSDSPALGRTGVALQRSIGRGSTPLPVVLVEPMRAGWATANPGPLHELRTGIAVKLGLALIAASTRPPAAANWVLHHVEAMLKLIDPTSATLAEFAAPDNQQWFAAAAQHGSVATIYGTTIGVRRPAMIPPGGYDDRTRATELDDSVKRRIAAWGMVSFMH